MIVYKDILSKLSEAGYNTTNISALFDIFEKNHKEQLIEGLYQHLLPFVVKQHKDQRGHDLSFAGKGHEV